MSDILTREEFLEGMRALQRDGSYEKALWDHDLAQRAESAAMQEALAKVVACQDFIDFVIVSEFIESTLPDAVERGKKFIEQGADIERLRKDVVAISVLAREAAVLFEQVSPSASITVKESDRLDRAGRKLRILCGMLLAFSGPIKAREALSGSRPSGEGEKAE